MNINPPTPYAVVVTTDASDMVAVSAMAHPARLRGAVVETPVVHTRTEGQMRRAVRGTSPVVVMVDGCLAVVWERATASRQELTLEDAADVIARMYETREQRARAIAWTRNMLSIAA